MTELREGMYISATFRTNPDSNYFNHVFLPIKVLKEYKNFYDCLVLPHRNPIMSYGLSTPYHMTIDKFDLKKGIVIVRDFNEQAYVDKSYLLKRSDSVAS